MPLISTPPKRETVFPPSGTLSNLFGNPNSKAANAEFGNVMARAYAATVAVNDKNQASYARYQKFETVLEDSYKSRGLGQDLDNMTYGTRKGLVEAASTIYSMHEVAEEARADLRDYAKDAIEAGQASIDRVLQRVLARHI